MNSRLALRSVLVFCLALGAGRLLFPNAPSRPAAKARATVATEAAPTVNVSAPAVRAASVVRTPAAPPARPVVRDLTVVDGGVANDNVRLSHFIAGQYLEGTMHKSPQQFGAWVRWTPRRQELSRGGQPVATAQAAAAQAKLEKVGAVDRVSFSATYPDTDERMYVRKDGGIEHDIVLKRAPRGMDDGAELAYTGTLQLSPDLTLWDGKTQITGPYATKRGVQVKNRFGNAVFYLRAPVAWDATLTTAGGSLDSEKQATNPHSATTCEYRFDFDDAGVKLAVVTPGRWLADSARAYPVTIDPNLGPYGLADGDPPIYVGTSGSDTLIPANAGGMPLALTGICTVKADNGYGSIPLPFAFEYYGTVHAIDQPLYVHIDGFASFQDPGPFGGQCGTDGDNQPIPTPGYPDNAMFAYWDDLRISTQPGAGIYWFVDGVAPSRRLVIEWYKMAFAQGVANEYISFNLVLYECDNKIEIIIGQSGETDRGLCSVGIEDQTGLVGIQYDFNSSLNGAVNPINQNNLNNNNFNPFDPFAQNNNNLNNNNFGGTGGLGTTNTTNTGTTTQQVQLISPGTSLTFQRSAAGFLTVGFTPLAGCVPWTVCFRSAITIPASTCANGQTIPTSFGFSWDFKDGSGGFTKNLCHTWVTPGIYPVTLNIVDEFGTNTNQTFQVKVCDVPDVAIVADPQGGTVPLIVNLEARASAPTVRITTPPSWTIDRLGTNNEPGQFLTIGVFSGSPTAVRFDSPGIYRIMCGFSGQDTISGLATSGIGTVFIFVTAPGDVIDNSLLITDSQFRIDWVGKRVNPNPSGQPANSTVGLSVPMNPENDTMTIHGYLSMPGVQLSDLLNRRVFVNLNGVDAIFDGTFDANGHAVLPGNDQGRVGSFDLRLPSGAFTMTVKRSLYVQLGVADATNHRLLPAYFRIVIDGLFPPAGSPGAMITYNYNSAAYNAGPPASGSALGVFRIGGLGQISRLKSKAPADFGVQGGQELLLTGAFMVLSAKIKLEGNSVSADLKGILARYGGDDLRPRDNSDVVVSLNGWSEALNFTTTVGFKAGGKAPAQRFSFKRSKTLGTTGVANLQWRNRAGQFRIKVTGIPNELVGLNPSLGVQTVTAGLVITPDGGQVFSGSSSFDVTKISPTDFVRKPR